MSAVLPAQAFDSGSTIVVPVDGRNRVFFGHTAGDGSQHLWVFKAGGAVEAFPGRDPKSLPSHEGVEGKYLIPLTTDNFGIQPGARGSTLVATELARARRRDELRGLGSPAPAAAPAPATGTPAAGLAFGVPRAPTAASTKVAAPPPAPPAIKDDPRVAGFLDGTLSRDEVAGLSLQELEAFVVAVKALKERRERESSAKAALLAALDEIRGVVAPVAPSAYDAPADDDADADADDDIGLDADEAPVAGVG
jgi:hypothetical protein